MRPPGSDGEGYTDIVNKVRRALRITWGRLREQGVIRTLQWAADHAVRMLSGAPIRSLSQVTPQLHVGGQYRRRGWPRLTRRGVTAVVNMRNEFEDNHAAIAPARYLYLPTVDDCAPSLEDLQTGVAFIREEIAQGGCVYIHCGAGVGRAPAMAAAYLASTGLPPGEAWERIRAVRPFIRPKPVQVEQVERFAAQLRSS